MTLKYKTMTPVLAVGAAAAASAIALAPLASAGPPQCSNSVDSTVCQQPGSSSESVSPPQLPGSGQNNSVQNGQNGEYGPSGNVPPVGNH